MPIRHVVRRAAHRADHGQLLRRLEWRPSALPAGQPLDAVVVPASRRAHHLRGIAELAARYGTTLVVLASHDCDMAEVAELVAKVGGRALIAEIPAASDQRLWNQATSAERFQRLSAHRLSDLSLKRNLGLLLARRLGWRKIMFLDDDLTDLTTDQLNRVAHHLDANRYAGLKTLAFPDNSVVCHSARLVGRPQGIFVSGAALGVRICDDAEKADVFPDIYNEDWFALAFEAHENGVAYVGNVGQQEFNPFKDPRRAAHEEFGDLIAEGLYALFNDGLGLHRATANYWEQFIGVRRALIKEIERVLHEETNEHVQALSSLRAAWLQLGKIKAEDCIAFLDAWREDRRMFADLCKQASHERVADYNDAFDLLGVKHWQEARGGVPRVPALATVGP